MIFADLELARRLEGMDAAAGAASAAAEGQLRPTCGATSLAIAGGQAMFVGVGSPITQAFALGLHGAVTEAEMEQLEDFFRSRGSGVFIEVSPLADASLTEHLNGRGYRVLEYSNVLARQVPTAGARREVSNIQVKRAEGGEAELWSRVVAEGFLGPDYPREMLALFEGLFRTEEGSAYLAWLEGKAVGGGGMMVHEGLANLFGDATIASHRGRGVQAELIAARLEAAEALGCHLLMGTTMCGSISQRNYERHGFRVAYTRTKWHREWV
jgi:GNAT superfamily N-acetyltransferase